MDKSTKKKIDTLKIYFYYILKKKWLYILILIAVLAIAFMDAYYPYLAGNIIDNLNMGEFEMGYTMILMLIGLIVLGAIIEQIQFTINGFIDMTVLHRAPKTEYVQKIQSLDYTFHSSKSTGSLISISSRINSALSRIFNNINIWGLVNALDVTISIYFMYRISPLVALIFSSTLLLAGIVGYPLVRFSMKARKKVIDLEDEIGGVISDNMIGFETVKAFGQEEYEIYRLNKKYDKWEKAVIKYLVTFRIFDGSVYIITIIGASIIIFLSYRNIQSGIWSTGMFVTLLGYATGMIWKVFNLLFKVRDYMKASVDLKKFVDVMNRESLIVNGKRAKDMGEITKGISFESISFSYTPSTGEDGKEVEEKQVLENVNFNIGLDETVALVGKSGSGKTTLTKLIMRYYDVDKGKILINGLDVREIRLDSLRKSIGLVPQDPVMFNESIKYNLSYGNPKATMDEVIGAARRAALHDFIDSLPKKYDTVVGERGIKLSGGQRQRLAIARVMLLNPEIIIFDEATSQLDSENEKAIQKAFKNLTKQKTTIVIAHRLSTIMHADRIVVFDEGKIVEIGSHTELMKSDGIYSDLWKLQTESVI